MIQQLCNQGVTTIRFSQVASGHDDDTVIRRDPDVSLMDGIVHDAVQEFLLRFLLCDLWCGCYCVVCINGHDCEDF